MDGTIICFAAAMEEIASRPALARRAL